MRTRLLSLFLLLCTCVPAQEDLKVGLVLSGGGAKGYAHIGALRVIEEAGIRVDYIGGTSMGAIVGGLYAAGYSADQLEQLLRSVDILAELQDAVERENRTIYEKLYNEKYLLSISMQDFSIQLPTALSDGQRVHDLFANWTAHVGHIRDFDKLPIPYLAVATDLESGDDVVIEKGMLAEAMRASSALPGVLSPFMLEGRLLTDGGVSNNYPAEEVKAKDMDYILGISVEADPLKAEEITSVDRLLMQIAFFQANRRNIEQYEVTDLDIKPQLSGFSVLSFADIDTLINAGFQAASEMRPALDSLAALQRGEGRGRDTTAASIPEYLNASRINITGNRDLSRRQILSFFEEKLPGIISWEDFREGLTALHVSGRYSNINYRWEKVSEGSDEVILDLIFEPSQAFGQQLRVGLHYDQVYRSNLLLNFSMYDFIVDNTIASFDLIAGNSLRYLANYRVNRINGSAFGLRSRLDYVDVGFDLPNVTSTELGITLDRLDYRFSDINLEAYWDFRQTTNSFTGVAAELKNYRTVSNQLASTDSSSLFNLGNKLYFVPKLYLLYDKLNATNFPTRGFSIDAEARAIRDLSNGEPGWAFNADINFKAMVALGKKHALGLETSFGGFLDRTALPYRYYLGSNNRNLMNNFKRFPSIDVGEASGSQLAMGELFLQLRLIPNHFLHLGGQTAFISNPDFIPSSVKDNLLAAGVIGYGFDSPLGPIELTYAHGNEGSGLYFNLGHWF